MRAVDRYGMNIDSSSWDERLEEKKKAKKLRDRYRKGFNPMSIEKDAGLMAMDPVGSTR